MRAKPRHIPPTRFYPSPDADKRVPINVYAVGRKFIVKVNDVTLLGKYDTMLTAMEMGIAYAAQRLNPAPYLASLEEVGAAVKRLANYGRATP